VNVLQLCRLTVFTQINFGSRLSSTKVQFYTENGLFAFEPLFGGLEARYDVYLRLTGKLEVDFLLVIIELFC